MTAELLESTLRCTMQLCVCHNLRYSTSTSTTNVQNVSFLCAYVLHVASIALRRAPVLVGIALIERGMKYEEAVELIRMCAHVLCFASA